MKKYLSFALSFLLCISLLLACAKPSTQPDQQADGTQASSSAETKEKALTLWLPPYGTDGESLDQEWWSKTLEPFAKENNVKLTIEITPWGNYEEKYLTAFSSGEGPDVGYMYLEMFNDFIDMGVLEPMDTYFNEEEKSNYIFFNKGLLKGKQYALPFIVGNARILYVNKEHLSKAGVTTLPKTWDDLKAAISKLRDAQLDGVIPFAQEWADPAIGGLNNIFYPYLWQAGGDIFNEKGEVALLENDAAVKVAKFLKGLKDEGLLTEESMGFSTNNLRDLFSEGKIAMMYSAANAAVHFDKAGIQWDFVPSLEDKTFATWIAADSLVLNANSKEKDLAVKLMKHITSPAIMEKFHQELSPFPPISKNEKSFDNPRFQSLYADETYMKTLPVAPHSFKVMDKLYKNLQLMMLGDLSPEDAIQQVVDYAKSLN